MFLRTTIVALLGLCLLSGLSAEPAPPTSTTTSAPEDSAGKADAECLKLIGKLAPGIVRVEYTLQYDKGEPPRGREAQYIQEDRPLEMAGLLIATDKVVSYDAAIHPRFVKSVAVRADKKLVPARITGA